MDKPRDHNVLNTRTLKINYELLIDVKAGMEHPKDFIDYCNYSDAYDALKEDEPVLARLFEQTRYGKAVQDLVDKVIAKSSIAEMPDMEYVVRTPKTLAVGENTPLKEYEQEKVR